MHSFKNRPLVLKKKIFVNDTVRPSAFSELIYCDMFAVWPPPRAAFDVTNK